MLRHAHRWCLFTLSVLFLPASDLAAQGDIPKPEHPEPMSVREAWANLNGTWDFRFDPEDSGLNAEWFQPGAEGFDRQIVVPFPWESKLSGIQDTSGASKIGWYRRNFSVPEAFPADHRVWLHFGAVDWRADVWVNGKKVAEHDGGYTPFAADVTDALNADCENVLVVRAFDPTDPSLPTGKQVGWYTPSSGIWQTVWLEARPAVYINDFFIVPEIDPAQVTIDVSIAGNAEDLTAAVRSSNETVGSPEAPVQDGKARLVVPVSDPHIWFPEVPYLYEIQLDLKDAQGNRVDSVGTYFALRTIARGKHPTEDFECILLNGIPQYIRGALDQSFNPDGLYTAPSDEYIRRDLFLAKYAGLNCLRIHIKPEEPRRLYWADKGGLLIMEDMPNTWRQNETARKAWESTMREVIARDKNHPGIWSWVAFNETWGLGSPDDYKQDQDTQDWVNRMVDEIRRLDPTRLVEDNSPCNYDHVTNTDLNSWHFYIDDHEAAREHIAHVVEQTRPGSSFNYCPGLKQSTAPLINSEYGSVSAGGGDRDVSWGFRDLTTLLRKHNKIQGYIYTELTDIEWEHNGFYNYDRTPKFFGYDAFLPDMRPNELNGADFVGYDAPPVIVAKPGETIEVPVFISHYSSRSFEPKLRWWLQGWDDRGDEIMVSIPQSIPATWKPFEVTWQEPIRVKVPDRPFVGALILTLREPNNQRFAVNYVNVVVKPEAPLPRIQRINDHDVFVRFTPEEYSANQWTTPAEAPPGKVYGHGSGFFEYRLQLPPSVIQAKPDYLLFKFEASAKAQGELVDWPERKNPQDYPQTDERTFPTTLLVSFNGKLPQTDDLPNDPADARGVLSHLNRIEHGSHGESLLFGGELPQSIRDDLAAGKPLVIRLEVPRNAPFQGGLALYGATTGQYPMDPMLEIHTIDTLPKDLGVDPNTSLAIDTAAARRVSLLSTGAANASATEWAYTTEQPAESWNSPEFDDSAWQRGRAGFGTRGTPGIQVQTRWNSPEIWLRTRVELPALNDQDLLTLRLYHDEDVEVFVNGKPLFSANGYVTDYFDVPLNADQKALFREGENVIAVRCRQTGGGQGVDLGLRLLKSE